MFDGKKLDFHLRFKANAQRKREWEFSKIHILASARPETLVASPVESLIEFESTASFGPLSWEVRGSFNIRRYL